MKAKYAKKRQLCLHLLVYSIYRLDKNNNKKQNTAIFSEWDLHLMWLCLFG